jgi:peptidoglycan-N-acetylglucosamine deacetylase
VLRVFLACVVVTFHLAAAFAGQTRLSAAIHATPDESHPDMKPLVNETFSTGEYTFVIWAGSSRYRNVALTFDDGPNPRYTPDVLKILETNDVRATFFLIGQHAEQHPDLVGRIHLAGHAIGNHTYSHTKLTQVTSEAIKRQVEMTGDIIRRSTGEDTVLFRPPGGVFDGRSLAELARTKLDVVLWSVDSRDWTRPGIAAIKDNILPNVRNGSIILCHDGYDQIVEALPDVIKSLKEQGYQFITIPEMIEWSR